MSGTTLGGLGTLGTNPYAYASPQQMMAAKLMEAPAAPQSNSSAESAGANTLAQGMQGALRGAMMNPETMRQMQDWWGRNFGSQQPVDPSVWGSLPATPI